MFEHEFTSRFSAREEIVRFKSRAQFANRVTLATRRRVDALDGSLGDIRVGSYLVSGTTVHSVPLRRGLPRRPDADGESEMAASVEAIRQESVLLRTFSRPYAVGTVEARIVTQVP